MPEPILMPDGNALTDWNDQFIEATGPTGQKVLVARSAAPPALRQAVEQAERATGGPASALPAASPLGFLDHNTPGPGVQMPSTRVPTPAGPETPDNPQPAGVVGGMTSPLAAYDAEIARLRAAEAGRGGGGSATRTARSVTSLPAAAAAEVREMQTPIDESVAEQQLAIEDQAGVEERGLGEVAQLHAEQGRRIEQELTDQESLKSSYEQRFATEQQKLAELNQKAQQEIDPKRYWKNADTGNKILAVISSAIGGYVEGLTGGRVKNRGLDMIQAVIERDINAQIENRNRAERDVGRQAGIVGLLGDKYTDDLQKRQAAMVLANEAVAKQIDGIAAGMQGEKAKAQAMQLSAQLRQEAATRAQAFVAQIAGSETTQTQSVSGGGGARAGGANALSAAVYGPGATYDSKTYVPGAFIATGEHRAANSDADAVELNKQTATVTQMLRKADQIEQAAKNGGKLSPQKRAEVAALYASLTLDVKNAESAGALDAGTQQITADILGPKPTDLTSIGNTIPLFKQTVRAKHLAAIQNRTHQIDPTTIPLAAKQRTGGAGIQTQAPATRPLAVEEEP